VAVPTAGRVLSVAVLLGGGVRGAMVVLLAVRAVMRVRFATGRSANAVVLVGGVSECAPGNHRPGIVMLADTPQRLAHPRKEEEKERQHGGCATADRDGHETRTGVHGSLHENSVGGRE
jgi:hypothetical protein